MSRLALTLVFSLHALLVAAQLPGQTVRFSSVLTGGIDGTTGDCLTATKNADGAAVVVQPCGNNATQLNSWLVPNGAGAEGQIRIFGDKCLDVKDGINADGAKLQIWTCSAGNTNQLWVPGGYEIPIAWSGKNKCIDLTDGKTTAGNQFQVWTCDYGNANQRYNVLDVTEPKTRTIHAKKDTTKCVTASTHAVNASVIMLPCIPNVPEQAFFAPFPGQLAVDGPFLMSNSTVRDPRFLCVTPQDDKATTDGTKLVLVACDEAGKKADQLWGWAPSSGTINNGAYGKMVMDLTDGALNTGTQLQIWFGNIFSGAGENINQQWVQTFVF
ncbi:hypothetical protein MIND_01282000 [Mycena indigotica]|uniref:Ricin B lectin domain-containing protein n=1 Tax=Mycena indigotica TaxID=2126181 RepID=A0A8H6S351_9AGAR|nr:uncharacterized protein MIND_01282000 [Mycena indigotica]KAF7291375.1 hypothetical protein MIND_01282000 [Mycena indigotica]